jgi:hypothetical protein
MRKTIRCRVLELLQEEYPCGYFEYEGELLMTATQASEYLDVPRNAVSRILFDLARKGLITRYEYLRGRRMPNGSVCPPLRVIYYIANSNIASHNKRVMAHKALVNYSPQEIVDEASKLGVHYSTLKQVRERVEGVVV